MYARGSSEPVRHGITQSNSCFLKVTQFMEIKRSSLKLILNNKRTKWQKRNRSIKIRQQDQHYIICKYNYVPVQSAYLKIRWAPGLCFLIITLSQKKDLLVSPRRHPYSPGFK